MDRQLDKRIRQRIHRMYGDRFSEEVLKTPDCSLCDENSDLNEGVESKEFFASHGGYAEFCALAKMSWEESRNDDLMCPDSEWAVFLRDGSVVEMIPAKWQCLDLVRQSDQYERSPSNIRIPFQIRVPRTQQQQRLIEAAQTSNILYLGANSKWP